MRFPSMNPRSQSTSSSMSPLMMRLRMRTKNHRGRISRALLRRKKKKKNNNSNNDKSSSSSNNSNNITNNNDSDDDKSTNNDNNSTNNNSIIEEEVGDANIEIRYAVDDSNNDEVVVDTRQDEEVEVHEDDKEERRDDDDDDVVIVNAAVEEKLMMKKKPPVQQSDKLGAEFNDNMDTLKKRRKGPFPPKMKSSNSNNNSSSSSTNSTNNSTNNSIIEEEVNAAVEEKPNKEKPPVQQSDKLGAEFNDNIVTSKKRRNGPFPPKKKSSNSNNNSSSSSISSTNNSTNNSIIEEEVNAAVEEKPNKEKPPVQQTDKLGAEFNDNIVTSKKRRNGPFPPKKKSSNSNSNNNNPPTFLETLVEELENGSDLDDDDDDDDYDDGGCTLTPQAAVAATGCQLKVCTDTEGPAATITREVAKDCRQNHHSCNEGYNDTVEQFFDDENNTSPRAAASKTGGGGGGGAGIDRHKLPSLADELGGEETGAGAQKNQPRCGFTVTPSGKSQCESYQLGYVLAHMCFAQEPLSFNNDDDPPTPGTETTTTFPSLPEQLPLAGYASARNKKRRSARPVKKLVSILNRSKTISSRVKPQHQSESATTASTSTVPTANVKNGGGDWNDSRTTISNPSPQKEETKEPAVEMDTGTTTAVGTKITVPIDPWDPDATYAVVDDPGENDTNNNSFVPIPKTLPTPSSKKGRMNRGGDDNNYFDSSATDSPASRGSGHKSKPDRWAKTFLNRHKKKNQPETTETGDTAREKIPSESSLEKAAKSVSDIRSTNDKNRRRLDRAKGQNLSLEQREAEADLWTHLILDESHANVDQEALRQGYAKRVTEQIYTCAAGGPVKTKKQKKIAKARVKKTIAYARGMLHSIDAFFTKWSDDPFLNRDDPEGDQSTVATAATPNRRERKTTPIENALSRVQRLRLREEKTKIDERIELLDDIHRLPFFKAIGGIGTHSRLNRHRHDDNAGNSFSDGDETMSDEDGTATLGDTSNEEETTYATDATQENDEAYPSDDSDSSSIDTESVSAASNSSFKKTKQADLSELYTEVIAGSQLKEPYHTPAKDKPGIGNFDLDSLNPSEVDDVLQLLVMSQSFDEVVGGAFVGLNEEHGSGDDEELEKKRGDTMSRDRSSLSRDRQSALSSVQTSYGWQEQDGVVIIPPLEYGHSLDNSELQSTKSDASSLTISLPSIELPEDQDEVKRASEPEDPTTTSSLTEGQSEDNEAPIIQSASSLSSFWSALYFGGYSSDKMGNDNYRQSQQQREEPKDVNDDASRSSDTKIIQSSSTFSSIFNNVVSAETKECKEEEEAGAGAGAEGADLDEEFEKLQEEKSIQPCTTKKNDDNDQQHEEQEEEKRSEEKAGEGDDDGHMTTTSSFASSVYSYFVPAERKEEEKERVVDKQQGTEERWVEEMIPSMHSSSSVDLADEKEKVNVDSETVEGRQESTMNTTTKNSKKKKKKKNKLADTLLVSTKAI